MKTSRNDKVKKKETVKHLDKVKQEREQMGQINTRVRFLLILVIGILICLAGRILTHSLSTNEQYSRTALAQLNYGGSTKLAMPGDILDANMAPLASSYRVYILILDPKVILETDEELYTGTLDRTAQLVADMFGLNAEAIKQAIKENPTSSYLRYSEKADENNPGVMIPVYGGKTIVQEDQKEAFLEAQNLINNPPATTKGEDETEAEETKKDKGKVKGVWFDEEARRYYPYENLGSKLIGFRTIDTSEGLWGIENYYNDMINGINGREVGYLNSEADLEKTVIPAQDGYTIVSTLDITLCKMIADEIEEWFNDTDENGQKIHSAKSVSVLAMDPNTGAIKAYVTDTDFDLNEPSNLRKVYSDEYVTMAEQNEIAYQAAYEAAEKQAELTGTSIEFEWDSELYPTTTDLLNRIWRNTLISDSFEPGSTGKMITYAAALEENLIEGDTIFQCDGSRIIGGYKVKCHNYAHGGCGTITSMTAVASSCNMAFVEMGELLGADKFSYYQQLFNIGQKTGIDLPGEASCAGLYYPAEQLNATINKTYALNLATHAFGQNYNVTRIQLATAFCSTINGGYYYKPYVVSKILDSSGAVIEDIEPTVVRQVISEEASEIVRAALRKTVSGDDLGTGGGVQVSDDRLIEGIEFIAKTGTAQKHPISENKYLISVISAAPMDNPQLVLYVTIDEYGGALQADSAPAQYLSGDIWGTIHDYVGIYSSEEEGPDQYRNEEPINTGSESWPDGSSMIEDMNGQPSEIPVPPEDTGTGTYNGIIVDPLSIINPNDVLPEYSEQ